MCGAGDAYAAGVLYAIAQGYDLEVAGEFAARVAATVIGRHGAELAEADARELVRWLPDHCLQPSHWPSLRRLPATPAGAAPGGPLTPAPVPVATPTPAVLYAAGAGGVGPATAAATTPFAAAAATPVQAALPSTAAAAAAPIPALQLPSGAS